MPAMRTIGSDQLMQWNVSRYQTAREQIQAAWTLECYRSLITS